MKINEEKSQSLVASNKSIIFDAGQAFVAQFFDNLLIKFGKFQTENFISKIFIKNNTKKISYNSHEIQSSKEKDVIKLSLLEKNKEIQIEGTGNGPIDAFINALNDHLSSDFKVSDYHQHSISSGSDASAAAYIEIQNKTSSDWGAGIDQNTTVASYKAILNCINKILS